MFHQLISLLIILHLITGFHVMAVHAEGARAISGVGSESNRVERSFENGTNNSDRPKIIQKGIGKVERDIIISVLIVACVTPLVCGTLMIACQLATQIKKKHIRRRFCKNRKAARMDCNQSTGISRTGPLQLHNSFPVYINGITREEMECYMNMTALAREQGLCANQSIVRNNPETGQLEGEEGRVPLTPPHIRIKPRIASQYPSPTSSPVNVNGGFSPIERNPRNLYPPLPLFKNDIPVFEMQPKNSTPRSPLDTPPQAKHRPSIRETPDRAVKRKRLDLLRQMTMSPPPSYVPKEMIGKSMPCLSFPNKGAPYSSNLNVSTSGTARQKDRSASESDLSI